ncbi:MAG: hypothetical protein AABX61_02925 [Nanoarchaeota archaeon]
MESKEFRKCDSNEFDKCLDGIINEINLDNVIGDIKIKGKIKPDKIVNLGDLDKHNYVRVLTRDKEKLKDILTELRPRAYLFEGISFMGGFGWYYTPIVYLGVEEKNVNPLERLLKKDAVKKHFVLIERSYLSADPYSGEPKAKAGTVPDDNLKVTYYTK